MLIDVHSGKIITKNERNVNEYFEKTYQFFAFFDKNRVRFKFLYQFCTSINIIDAHFFICFLLSENVANRAASRDEKKKQT